MLSKNATIESFQQCFQCLKDRLGPIKVELFFTTASPDMFEAWCNVMPKAQIKLYSFWHCEKMIRTKLLAHYERKTSQYFIHKKSFYALVNEKNGVLFRMKAEEFNSTLTGSKKNIELKEFFDKNFLDPNVVPLWAFHKRSDSEINFDKEFEKTHR